MEAVDPHIVLDVGEHEFDWFIAQFLKNGKEAVVHGRPVKQAVHHDRLHEVRVLLVLDLGVLDYPLPVDRAPVGQELAVEAQIGIHFLSQLLPLILCEGRQLVELGPVLHLEYHGEGVFELPDGMVLLIELLDEDIGQPLAVIIVLLLLFGRPSRRAVFSRNGLLVDTCPLGPQVEVHVLAVPAGLKVEGFLEDRLAAQLVHLLAVHGSQNRNRFDVVVDLYLLHDLHHVLAQLLEALLLPQLLQGSYQIAPPFLK